MFNNQRIEVLEMRVRDLQNELTLFKTEMKQATCDHDFSFESFGGSTYSTAQLPSQVYYCKLCRKCGKQVSISREENIRGEKARLKKEMKRLYEIKGCER